MEGGHGPAAAGSTTGIGRVIVRALLIAGAAVAGYLLCSLLAGPAHAEPAAPDPVPPGVDLSRVVAAVDESLPAVAEPVHATIDPVLDPVDSVTGTVDPVLDPVDSVVGTADPVLDPVDTVDSVTVVVVGAVAGPLAPVLAAEPPPAPVGQPPAGGGQPPPGTGAGPGAADTADTSTRPGDDPGGPRPEPDRVDPPRSGPGGPPPDGPPPAATAASASDAGHDRRWPGQPPGAVPGWCPYQLNNPTDSGKQWPWAGPRHPDVTPDPGPTRHPVDTPGSGMAPPVTPAPG